MKISDYLPQTSKRARTRSRDPRMMLMLLVWLGMALRVWGLDAQSLWRDEVDTVRFATQPLPQLLAMFTTPGHNGALYYLVMRPWIAFFGHVDFALRYASVLAGVLVLPLAYQALRRWIGERSALLTVLFLTVSPYAIWYSQELRMYAFILAIVLAATRCWQDAFERQRSWCWVVYVVLISGGIYMHFLIALLLPTHILMSLLAPHRWLRRWKGWVLAYAAFVLPYIPLAWWQKKLLFSPTFRTGHPFVPWPQMIYKLLTVFSVGIHNITLPMRTSDNIRIVPLLFLMLSGLALHVPALQRKVSWRVKVWLLLWFLVPVAGLYLISLELPLFTERYLIWTMPAVYALAALGVETQRRWPMLSFSVLALVLVLFLVGIGYQVHIPVKPDMRNAVQYVESHRTPESKVLLHLGYLIHAYTYYAPEARPHLLEAPAPGPHGTPEQTGEEILRRLNGARDVWLVESESAMWDPKGLVRQWLDQHATRVEDRAFVGVRVTHYRMFDVPSLKREGKIRTLPLRRGT